MFVFFLRRQSSTTGIGPSEPDPDLQRRVERLERETQALRAELSRLRSGNAGLSAGAAADAFTSDSGATRDVLEALQSGNKIEAIRRYRAATGLGLKEAKDAVEAIEH